MKAPIVFIDFAGPDETELANFYAEVFGWQIGDDLKFKIAAATPIEGAFRRDPAEKRFYIGVPDVTECLERVERAGGTVDAPRFEVPGVVVLGLFRDPAGNPMGLVEMDGDQPRIP